MTISSVTMYKYHCMREVLYCGHYTWHSTCAVSELSVAGCMPENFSTLRVSTWRLIFPLYFKLKYWVQINGAPTSLLLIWCFTVYTMAADIAQFAFLDSCILVRMQECDETWLQNAKLNVKNARILVQIWKSENARYGFRMQH